MTSCAQLPSKFLPRTKTIFIAYMEEEEKMQLRNHKVKYLCRLCNRIGEYYIYVLCIFLWGELCLNFSDKGSVFIISMSLYIAIAYGSNYWLNPQSRCCSSIMWGIFSNSSSSSKVVVSYFQDSKVVQVVVCRRCITRSILKKHRKNF